MKTRFTLIPLVGILLAGLFLTFASGAKAAVGDQSFTLSGNVSVIGSDFSIQGQPFLVEGSTVCTDLATVKVDCASLKDQFVKVMGYISLTDSKYHATSMQVVTDPGVFTYTGELKAFSGTAWTLNNLEFKVGSTTILPDFYELKDTVVTTYTVDTATGDFLSKEFKILNYAAGNTYTYTDTLTKIDAGSWTVGKYTFLVDGVTLPPVVNLNDTVKVTFTIVDGKYIASAVELVETYVGTKVESNRCENRFKDQPAVNRLAKEFNEKPEKITEYFCKGFGIGEIKLAYKTANESYTAAMLLAMRANGKSWGEIKHLVANAPVTNPVTPATTIGAGSPVTNTNTGGPANHGKSNNGNGQGKDKPDHGKKP